MKQKIRKTAVGLIAALTVLSLGTATAFAAGPGAGRTMADATGDGTRGNAGNACTYTDSDGDGICDNLGRNCLSPNGYGRNYMDADGDGICDNAGSACAYTDLDGDGICDNLGGSNRAQNSCGRNYTDDDGDGICDNRGQNPASRCGQGKKAVDFECGGDYDSCGTRQGKGCGGGHKK